MNHYQKERLLAFLHPEQYSSSNGFIYLKVKEMLSTAGWFGQSGVVGAFSSEQTNYTLASFIYNLGWAFSIVLLTVLTLLLIRLLLVSRNIGDRYGRVLVSGGLGLFAVQFLYHAIMTVGWVPFMPISLPFLSYGLAPTLINSVVFGVVLGVYRRKNLVNPQA